MGGEGHAEYIEDVIEDIRRLKHRFVHCDLTNILVSLWTDDDHAIYPSEVQSEANVCNSCLLLLGGPNVAPSYPI
jgi:hypothetical protein